MADDAESAAGPETKASLARRHAKELMALKNQVARLGKKKKDEASALEKEVTDRHAAELAAFSGAGDRPEPADVRRQSRPARPNSPRRPQAGANGHVADAPDALTDSMARVEVAASDPGAVLAAGAPKGPSKAQKARDKKAREAREREDRIAAEQAGMGASAREVEESGIAALIAPLGLRVYDIRPDGHCLYRAIADQIGLGGPAPSAESVRAAAAGYMRTHEADLLPYAEADVADSADPGEAYRRHCDAVESTAAWGGQLEARAAAEALGRRLEIYSAGMPVVHMGPEGGAPLRLAFQRHAYGLGEHYNSLRPIAD